MYGGGVGVNRRGGKCEGASKRFDGQKNRASYPTEEQGIIWGKSLFCQCANVRGGGNRT